MAYKYEIKQEGKRVRGGIFKGGDFGKGVIWLYDILRPLIPLEFELDINKIKEVENE